MSAWNGHYECTCCHPLFLFSQFGDMERCALRVGNVQSAAGWEDVLKLVFVRYRGKVSRLYFRADAAFANPDLYEYLEVQDQIHHSLADEPYPEERIGHLLTRPIGRPPNEVRR